MGPIAIACPGQTRHPENRDASVPHCTRSSSSCDTSVRHGYLLNHSIQTGDPSTEIMQQSRGQRKNELWEMLLHRVPMTPPTAFSQRW